MNGAEISEFSSLRSKPRGESLLQALCPTATLGCAGATQLSAACALVDLQGQGSVTPLAATDESRSPAGFFSERLRGKASSVVVSALEDLRGDDALARFSMVCAR
jgi:hypothetical protein